jgi:predicted dehydrogenase
MSVDFRKRRLLVVNNVEFRVGRLPKVKAERPRFAGRDPLEEELKSFVRCVTERTPPRVGGEQGRAALAAALRISEKVRQGLAGRENLLPLSRRLVEIGDGPE